ncbi:MAG: hypothetical protein LKF96_01630 [Treponema sp.]|jgi:hypothetical protein|nr:hypothetical protein [Treponema sp.]
MIDAVSALERKYTETFDEEMRMLERRRAHDTNLTIDELENTLRSLYIVEGNDIEGRGAIQDQVIAAEIAAYEAFITTWKKELETGAES